MSAAPRIVPAEPSRHFQSLLSALLNASTEDYDDCLEELNDYVAAIENVSAITPFQQSVNMLVRTKEKERAAIGAAVKKLPRFEVRPDGATQQADLGDWLSVYDVLEILR